MEELKNENPSKSFMSDLVQIAKRFIMEPVTGTFALFEEKKDRLITSAILVAATVALYFFLPLFLMGSYASYIGIGKVLLMGLKLDVLLIVFLSLAAGATFGLQFISSKPDIKVESFVAGMLALPLILFFLLIVTSRLFSSEVSSIITGSISGGGLFVTVILLYMLFMMVNIVMQALRAAKAKDAMAWYVAPAIILISFYLTSRLASVLF